MKNIQQFHIIYRAYDVPALYHSGPTIPAPIWKIYARARRVSFPAPIFENPSGPIIYLLEIEYSQYTFLLVAMLR